MIRVADWLMRRLADEGLRHVFLLPGGGAMYLDDALACEPRLTAVACHHEQACAIAAEGYGRTGTPAGPGFGVALVTSGPGATNTVTAVAGAWIDSVPLLVISGQVKRADRLGGRPLRQGGVQEVDIVSMIRPITKYAAMLDEPEQVAFHFEMAMRRMREGRPGPVWLDVPLDVQAAPMPCATFANLPPAQASRMPTPSAVAEVAERLKRAARPLLLVGHGVRVGGAATLAGEVAEAYGIPMATTWNALDLLPYAHALAAGRPGTVALRGANFAIQSCDLLLAVGCRLDNVVTAHALDNFARRADRIVVDIDAAELEKFGVSAMTAVQADAQSFLEALLTAAPSEPQARPVWLARIADWKVRHGPMAGRTLPMEGAASHYQLVDALSDLLPADSIVATGSSGLAIEVFYSTFRNKPGQRIFLTSGLGAMGYGLPAAVGACLGSGGRPLVLVESDGSLMLNLQELATIAALKLPIAIILMNNGGYASIRNTQRNYFDGRFIGTGPESGLGFPDFVALAESFGLDATTIGDVRDLRAELAVALARPRPCLIDVRLLPDEVLSPKVAAIPSKDGSMTSMPLEDMSPLLDLRELAAEMDGDLDPRSQAVRSAG